LVIDIDVAAPFTLKEFVTPEPSTALLAALGLPALLRRRRRRD